MCTFKEQILAAFAQFGSDLDKTTLAQIERGKRLVELLKQGQYVPQSLEDQIVILYAGTQGHLDEVPVESVKKFEEGLLRFMKDRHDEIRAEIMDKKAIDDSLKDKLNTAIEDYKKEFQA